ncbi:hypothetical protein ACFQZ4_51915 [Catellatospora coxensis]
MPEQSALERSYRRLLLAYPGFYRRERGLEILTTLLDAAKPGQVRATIGEAAHLVLSGLRFRVAPPGTAGRIAAGVAALWTAVVLGGVGAYVAWDSSSTAPAAIDDPRISALADALVGQPPARVDHGGGDLLGIAYGHQAGGRFQTLGAEELPGMRPVPSGHNRLYEGSTRPVASSTPPIGGCRPTAGEPVPSPGRRTAAAACSGPAATACCCGWQMTGRGTSRRSSTWTSTRSSRAVCRPVWSSASPWG